MVQNLSGKGIVPTWGERGLLHLPEHPGSHQLALSWSSVAETQGRLNRLLGGSTTGRKTSPSRILFSSDVCSSCADLDAGTHTPIRILYHLRADPPPSREEARRQLEALSLQAGGIGARPDSPLMLLPLAYAGSSPEWNDFILAEVDSLLQDRSKDHGSGDRGDSLGAWRASEYGEPRFLREVQAYVMGLRLATLSAEEIVDRWNARETREPKRDRFRIETEVKVLLYAISRRRILSMAGPLQTLLEKSAWYTGYFEWHLTQTLGEIGNEATAIYLVEQIGRSLQGRYVCGEFIPELLTSFKRIYHRLGRHPSIEAAHAMEASLSTLLEGPNAHITSLARGPGQQIRDLLMGAFFLRQSCPLETTTLS